MNRPRLIRGLRIAWSVAWGILCVLLVVLWVRSYWWKDYVGTPFGWFVGSSRGIVVAGTSSLPLHVTTQDWDFKSVAVDPSAAPWASGVLGFDHRQEVGLLNFFYVPYWFFILIAGVFTAIPWTPSNRFSLRTLLIATTAIAILLGPWSMQRDKVVRFLRIAVCVMFGILGVLLVAVVGMALFLPAIGASQYYHSVEQAMHSPRSVKKLGIMYEVQSKFPDEIKQLPNLEHLILTGDKSTQVPDWISQNRKIQNLWLHDFLLDPFPTALIELTQLEDLRLRNCMVAEVPPTIGNLKSLEILDLRNNNLSDLPDEISQLHKLRWLGLNGNPLSTDILQKVKRLLPTTDVEFASESK